MAIFIECMILCALFTVVVVTVSLKAPLAGIHNWPPAIQQKAKGLGLVQEEQLAGSKAVYLKKAAASVLFAVLFAAMVYSVNGARSFAAGFGYSYLIWTVVNWYDAFVIDCLWVCHDKRVRIPGTEDMKEYQDYLFHIKAGFRGQLLGLPVCLLTGALTAVLSIMM